MLPLKVRSLWETQALIAGSWIDADDGGTIAVDDPAGLDR
jgi:hypothetical protein